MAVVVAAGTFHPANPDRLQSAIEDAFVHDLGPGEVPDTDAAGPRDLVGLVVPHAGYRYSGPVAAHAYAALARDGAPETAVVVGPDHRGTGPAAAAAGELSTPLGTLDVDEAFIEALGDAVRVDDRPHAREHSVAVQLPFLQMTAPDASVVGIVLADQSAEATARLGEAVVRASDVLDRDVLVVASTDLSHVGRRYGQMPPDERDVDAFARDQDERAIDAIEQGDRPTFYARVVDDEITMCGPGAVGTLLTVAERTGAAPAEHLAYTTTQDVGDADVAVGYAAIRVDRSG